MTDAQGTDGVEVQKAPVKKAVKKVVKKVAKKAVKKAPTKKAAAKVPAERRERTDPLVILKAVKQVGVRGKGAIAAKLGRDVKEPILKGVIKAGLVKRSEKHENGEYEFTLTKAGEKALNG